MADWGERLAAGDAMGSWAAEDALQPPGGAAERPVQYTTFSWRQLAPTTTIAGKYIRWQFLTGHARAPIANGCRRGRRPGGGSARLTLAPHVAGTWHGGAPTWLYRYLALRRPLFAGASGICGQYFDQPAIRGPRDGQMHTSLGAGVTLPMRSDDLIQTTPLSGVRSVLSELNEETLCLAQKQAEQQSREIDQMRTAVSTGACLCVGSWARLHVCGLD